MNLYNFSLNVSDLLDLEIEVRNCNKCQTTKAVMYFYMRKNIFITTPCKECRRIKSKKPAKRIVHKVINGYKICTCCNENVPIEAFPYSKRQQKYTTQCKKCVNAKLLVLKKKRKESNQIRPRLEDEDTTYKECITCHQSQPYSNFYYGKDGYYIGHCKSCCAEKRKKYSKNKGVLAKYAKERELEKTQGKKCKRCNETKTLGQFRLRKKWNSMKHLPMCKICEREHNRELRLKNIDRYREAGRRKYQTSGKEYNKRIEVKLAKNMRSLVGHALKGKIKSGKTFELLGCTPTQLREFIESQFEEGMTWEKHGKFGFHIDHIIPVKRVNLNDPVEQRRVFNYKNLRPLWWFDNCSKLNKLDDEWERPDREFNEKISKQYNDLLNAKKE